MQTKKIVLASNNPGKLKEFQALFEPLSLHVIPQGQLGVSEADEPYGTFLENALTKARHASAVTGMPAVADDSGLCVIALDGAPGVYSARYAQLHEAGKGDADNNRLLLARMQHQTQRKACFVSVLVYVNHPEDPRPIVAEGVWWGEIADQPIGDNGFGYDPVFYVPDLDCTAAQLSAEQKNHFSHRAQALKILAQRLAELHN